MMSGNKFEMILNHYKSQLDIKDKEINKLKSHITQLTQEQNKLKSHINILIYENYAIKENYESNHFKPTNNSNSKQYHLSYSNSNSNNNSYCYECQRLQEQLNAFDTITRKQDDIIERMTEFYNKINKTLQHNTNNHKDKICELKYTRDTNLNTFKDDLIEIEKQLYANITAVKPLSPSLSYKYKGKSNDDNDNNNSLSYNNGLTPINDISFIPDTYKNGEQVLFYPMRK